MTQLFTISPNDTENPLLSQAGAILRAGGLVAFPTETVYGLGANALDATAVARIFLAKGRPASDPLIVHIADFAQLEGIAAEVPPVVERLAAQFWPGALTLILPRHANIPANVSANLGSVAVRMPNHPLALALLRAAEVPIAAPSANRFMRPSPTSAAHVLDDLRGVVDVVIDGGSTPLGVESTVLALTGSVPTVLRPGGVPLEALREMLPTLIYSPRYAAEDETVSAPGSLLKHYSPDADMRLFAGAAALPAMQQAAETLLAAGQRVGLLLLEEDAGAFLGLPVERFVLGSRADLAGVAGNLFAGLRHLDRSGVEVILARDVPQVGLGLAIWDRLVRAAEGQVTQADG